MTKPRSDADTCLADIAATALELRRLGLPQDVVWAGWRNDVDWNVVRVRAIRETLTDILKKRQEQP